MAGLVRLYEYKDTIQYGISKASSYVRSLTELDEDKSPEYDPDKGALHFTPTKTGSYRVVMTKSGGDSKQFQLLNVKVTDDKGEDVGESDRFKLDEGVSYDITYDLENTADSPLKAQVVVIDEETNQGVAIRSHLVNSRRSEIQTQKRVILPKVRREKDGTLPKGEELVLREGVQGEETIRRLVSYKNGEVESSKEVSKSVTKTPQDELVLVGTREYERSRKTRMRVVPYKYEYEADSKLKEPYKVVKEGAYGTELLTFEVLEADGEKYQERELDKVAQALPKNGKIKYNPEKASVEVKEETQEEDIPSYIMENLTQPKGYEQVLQKGVPRKVKKYYEELIVAGDVKKRALVKEEELEKGSPEVIERGVLEKKVRTVEIPYHTERRFTDELEKGESRVIQAGEDGLSEVEVYGTEILSQKITKAPVPEIIEEGR